MHRTKTQCQVVSTCLHTHSFFSFLVHGCALVRSANIPWASRFSLLLKPIITKSFIDKTQTWVLLPSSCSLLRTVTSGFLLSFLSFRFSGNLIRYLSGSFQNKCLLAVLEVRTQQDADDSPCLLGVHSHVEKQQQQQHNWHALGPPC